MRVLRVVVSLVVFTLIISSGYGRLVVAQSGEIGVFGLSKDAWEESLGASEPGPNDLTSYELETGDNVFIRFDDEDRTVYAEYVLSGYLSFSDAEDYALETLLPADVEFLGEHQNLLEGGGEEVLVSILLYQSDSVAQEFSGNSGIIVFTYGWHLGNFSVSIG